MWPPVPPRATSTTSCSPPVLAAPAVRHPGTNFAVNDAGRDRGHTDLPAAASGRCRLVWRGLDVRAVRRRRRRGVQRVLGEPRFQFGDAGGEGLRERECMPARPAVLRPISPATAGACRSDYTDTPTTLTIHERLRLMNSSRPKPIVGYGYVEPLPKHSFTIVSVVFCCGATDWQVSKAIQPRLSFVDCSA